MAIRIICIALAWLLSIAAFATDADKAPAVVAGKVFLDLNGNGLFDAGEKGIAGVRVTDGVDFVTTDPDGGYSIRIGADPTMPYKPSQTVGVCWPTGYWPSGQWWIRLSEMGDAGVVHFGLRKDVQKLPFVYLHMTDPHEHFNVNHLDFANFVNALPPEVRFILDTGDSFRPKSAEKPFNRLFISTVGNHDTSEGATPPPPPDKAGYAAWTRRLGPVRWSFDHAGIHFAGVDVIEGPKPAAMIDWLEKDFKSLPRGARIVLSYHYPDATGSERFTRLLRDYKVELIHGGHNHAYGYRDGTPPLLTAYHWWPPGTCNVLIAGEDRIDNGYYCIGCKRELGRHSRRCPMEWAEHFLLTSIRPHFAKLHLVASGELTGERRLELAEPQAYVRARIDPGQAKRVGLRIEKVEVAFTGEHLIVDGASVPFTFRAGQKTLDLTIFAHNRMLTVWANNYFFMEKPVAMVRVGQISIFAEGGSASIESAGVQEVREDPGNRSNWYVCNCAHGALRRRAVEQRE